MTRKDADSAPPAYAEALAKRGFKLGARLGTGAFGTVYRAVQVRLGREVAVKFFNNAAGRPVLADEHDRVRREARLLARVEHPALPYVITTGQLEDGAAGTPYIVMQLVDGHSLDVEIRKNGRLDSLRACSVATQILHALAAVHGQQIIHRDIKPNNILLARGRTWLVDFTLGASLVYERGLTRGTLPNQGLGVPDYASPEQLADASNVDHRTDIYSVGIVLFEMLAGHPRLDRRELVEQLRGVPKGLVEVVEKGVALERNDRYPGAREFAEALRPFLSRAVVGNETSFAFCGNAACGAAVRSSGGYFFAPWGADTDKTFCDACGDALVRRCPECNAALSDNAQNRVARKQSKTDEDGCDLYCTDCGHRIFEYPTCKSCRSLTKASDAGRDTAKDGCSKCGSKQPLAEAGDFGDDDIPF